MSVVHIVIRTLEGRTDGQYTIVQVHNNPTKAQQDADQRNQGGTLDTFAVVPWTVVP